jgi:hypothetical protein
MNMKADLLKSYLKYSYKGIIFWLIITALFYYFDRDTYWYTLYPVFFVISLINGYFSYENKLERIKKLKAKGLTEQDIINIEFVKKWEETRNNGLLKYCLKDGGVIAGAVLLFAVGIAFASIFPAKFKVILSSPGSMFSFIGYCYIVGACIGVIMFRILWIYKERRFAKLTDPFNILFESKKASFNDQV